MRAQSPARAALGRLRSYRAHCTRPGLQPSLRCWYLPRSTSGETEARGDFIPSLKSYKEGVERCGAQLSCPGSHCMPCSRRTSPFCCGRGADHPSPILFMTAGEEEFPAAAAPRSSSGCPAALLGPHKRFSAGLPRERPTQTAGKSRCCKVNKLSKQGGVSASALIAAGALRAS